MGNMEKWSFELSRYHIEYLPRTAIKGQVLADFIAEFTEPNNQILQEHEASKAKKTKGTVKTASSPLPILTGGQEDMVCIPIEENEVEDPNLWTIYVDGSSAKTGSGVGIVLITPDKTIIELAVRLGFLTTNNEAEYEALMIGLQAAQKVGATRIKVHTDSRLVASQLKGEFAAKNERMGAYRDAALELLQSFEYSEIDNHPRSTNSHADALATLASAIPSDLQRIVCIEFAPTPSIQVTTLAQMVNMTGDGHGGSWMTPLISYLKANTLPAEPEEAHRVRAQAARYWLSPDEILYRRSFTGPYLRCIHTPDIQTVLTELHEGSCGSHVGGRSLANRARTQGYWWPYMQRDALEYAKKCEKCQKFANLTHQPATELHNLVSPWPFAKWGLDIVGPMPKSTGDVRYLLIATDYYTKWVEAVALKKIDKVAIRNFLWKNIITRFGIPYAIIADNGTQFKNDLIADFCAQYGIRQHFSSVAYPQGNGQAEASNKVIITGLKRRLEKAKGAWVQELPSVLWAYRTTPRRSHGETPYSMVYGTEAVIPLEANFPTLRGRLVEDEGNDQAMGTELDYAEERRETAMIRLANYQNALSRDRQKIMRSREFRTGDWVLRRVLGSAVEHTDGKLGPSFEGPYKILSHTGTGAYYLEDQQGNPVFNPWNGQNLRRFYY